jgi:DNA repair photolyase
MDLRDHLLDLLSPHRVGDEIVPGARLAGASTELGLRLSFDVGGDDIHVEIVPAPSTSRFAARSRRLLFSYRTGRGRAAIDPKLGAALCRAVARIAEAHEDRVLEAIERDARAQREALVGETRVREVRVTRLLEPAGTPGSRYYTLSPYVGCLIGCRFCYAQDRVGLVRKLEGLPEAPWGSYVDARVNAPEVLERELAALPKLPVKFCPIVSDPYHAIERRFELTRGCLEVLAKERPARATIVLTRSRLIERDQALLAGMERAYAGMSIPTADDAIRRHFEPRGAPITARVEALRELSEAGVRTFAVVQPILPGSMKRLADALASAVSSVRIDVLHGTFGAAEDFADPRFQEATSPEWQETRAHELAEALRARGVALWPDELPPDLEEAPARGVSAG